MTRTVGDLNNMYDLLGVQSRKRMAKLRPSSISKRDLASFITRLQNCLEVLSTQSDISLLRSLTAIEVISPNVRLPTDKKENRIAIALQILRLLEQVSAPLPVAGGFIAAGCSAGCLILESQKV
jgi:hypothetical protein